MTLDDVKCFGSPRTSQIPRSASGKCSIADSTKPERIGHSRSSRPSRFAVWM
jgi:hypothetical protein